MTSRHIVPPVARFRALAAAAALIVAAACGSSPSSAPAAVPANAPAATPAPAASGAPTPVVMLLEPTQGSSAGHIDTFTWKPVDGADGYRLDLQAATDGRAVWTSPVVAATEARLPTTVSLEPEAYVWHVTALKGAAVLAVSPQGRFFVTP